MARRLIVSTMGLIAAMAVFLLVPAGTLDWPAAWGFLAEMGVLSLALGFWLARHDPALLTERLGSPFQRTQKSWDKIFIAVVMVLYIGWLVLIGLDARWGISRVPLWLQALGALDVALSTYATFLTFRANSYAAPVVKIQRERGHRVVSTGPYAYVRHPMYAGGLLMLVGMPLQLGSWLGLAAVTLLLPLLVFRILMEERTLVQELDGYRDYAQRVRWRLIPRIW